MQGWYGEGCCSRKALPITTTLSSGNFSCFSSHEIEQVEATRSDLFFFRWSASGQIPRLHFEPRQAGRLRRLEAWRWTGNDRRSGKDLRLRVSSQRGTVQAPSSRPMRPSTVWPLRLHRGLGCCQPMVKTFQRCSLWGYGLRIVCSQDQKVNRLGSWRSTLFLRLISDWLTLNSNRSEYRGLLWEIMVN